MPNPAHGELEEALSRLRTMLADGQAVAGLNVTELSARAKLGRTTTSQALSAGGPVPSAATVAALARALGLPERELLMLRRAAAGEIGTEHQEPGRPISEWDPHDLEVHPAGTSVTGGVGARHQRVLPGYVARAHDQVLADAVRDAAAGHGRMLVLVGSSSTGKTRACWEAVQPLAAHGWRLWHPFDPSRADAALDSLSQVAPHTVVWLNEAQHYLGDPQCGERIAAAVHALLTAPERAPVLVLGTLWPEYERQYQALPATDAPDPHSRVRELLAGRTLHVPSSFDAEALRATAELARRGDLQLAEALTRASIHGQVTQDLAGAPALLHTYEHGSPAARALLEVAMDARRLSIGLHLPQAFLTDAAIGYLADTDYDELTEDWAEAAYAELAKPVHGRQAALRRAAPRPERCPPGASPSAPVQAAGLSTGPVFRLADYLEQHGRTARRRLCPPGAFWVSAHTHLRHASDLYALSRAAESLHRMQWAHHLLHQAAGLGSAAALTHLGQLSERNADTETAKTFYLKAAHLGDGEGMAQLALLRVQGGDHEGANAMARRAAATSAVVLGRLAMQRDEVWDRSGAEFLARHAADAGHIPSKALLARLRKRAGDGDGAEELARQAHDAGHILGTVILAELRQRKGDHEGANVLYQQAADAGNIEALQRLWLWHRGRRSKGREAAEAFVQELIDRGAGEKLFGLAESLVEFGHPKYAEEVSLQAAAAGELNSLLRVVRQREEAADLAAAEELLKKPADAGEAQALVHLARLREAAGDRAEAESLLQQAVDAGDSRALVFWALLKERAGDPEAAEALAWQAPAFLPFFALIEMAKTRETAGNHESAGRVYRELADAQLLDPSEWQWPHGLDPDGSPTPPWQ
ncbi:tetratricopeptide repeat protein [Streptomyces sp. NPDC059989]|uniref:tetratricopeptide repeat protein n=1 Tax=Streptomyces sp. NPDC059989 TaxID=3347026 RepID=UPI003696EB5C